MRLSCRLMTACLAGVLGFASVSQAEWFPHHRRPSWWPDSTAPAPVEPAQPVMPTQPMTPKTEPIVDPKVETPAPSAIPPAEAPSFSPLTSAALGDTYVAMAAPGGYIDSAIPKTTFRLRYDAGVGMDRPDRAAFFYAAWAELAFHNHGIVNGRAPGVFFDPKGQGPAILPKTVNYQEVSSYFEVAVNNRFSVFLDVPFRSTHLNGNAEDPADRNGIDNDVDEAKEGLAEQLQRERSNGISDIQFGFKYAFLASCDEYLTFQFRTYVPTGDARNGVGNGHATVEPGLLYYRRLSDRLAIQGQLRDWIPIDAGPIGGNVLIYGVGAGYDAFQSGRFKITPVVEFVGFTFLSGFESVGELQRSPETLFFNHGVQNVRGETVVNSKLGWRTYIGDRQDVYIGWGHALTADHLYKDMVRVEYRFSF